jgi:hypothetical protein
VAAGGVQVLHPYWLLFNLHNLKFLVFLKPHAVTRQQ